MRPSENQVATGGDDVTVDDGERMSRTGEIRRLTAEQLLLHGRIEIVRGDDE